MENKEKNVTPKAKKPKGKNSFDVKKFIADRPIIVVMTVLGIITLLSLIYSTELFGETSVFNKSISNNVFIDKAYQYIPRLFRCVQIVFFGWVLMKIIQILITVIVGHGKSGKTAAKLLNSFVKYGAAILVILAILSTMGVDTSVLIASAGIAGLVIGLGAQSLIADIIAGIFIVFEGEFRVGDIVVIDGWRGTVQEIGMRTIKIMDYGGNVKIVNNSSVSSVVNQTKELSLAKATISIEYGESIPRVELVIKENIDNVKRAIPQIVEGPFYKGIDSLSDSSIDLLFVANCKEEDIYIVQRALNRELMMMFNENKINVPFPQIVINEPTKFDEIEMSKKEIKQADRFVKEQGELSKSMEETLE
ncbi:MAG: mechanosensitive ion channel family protein [Candidatus Methanomethylophilaceae archaeon]|nr:mechanosensitive ion channel family protein [Candidatus Methanomethylophilaceae archaeon]